MLDVACDICGKTLDEPGAIYLSPPKDGLARKRHVCVKCHKTFEAVFEVANWKPTLEGSGGKH